MIVKGGRGERLGRPVLSPGKKLTSQFLSPPPHTHTHLTYDILKKETTWNISLDKSLVLPSQVYKMIVVGGGKILDYLFN